MPGLRERKKVDTRRALSDAALELAFERGLENVTRDEIAARADVSLRTFNNYFANKYEALAYRQAERLRRGIEILRRCPPEVPLWTAITEAAVQPLEDDFRRARGIENSVPSRARLAETRKLLMKTEIRDALAKGLFDEWVEAIAERTGTDVTHDMYPRLVAATVRAVGDAAMDAYVVADPPVAITTLIRQGFAAVAAGLPVPTSRTGGKHHD
ncbi:MAG: TetR family transcriptional regulator [Mycobacterium sp.]|jgi:AcrR family transcriptional regulator|nr:TetR family transcriptional regulator [Mycobacterium sp.]